MKRVAAIIAMIAIVILVMVATPWLVYLFDTESDRGTFGDQFGATNALFGGIALILVSCSLILQSIELRNQVLELSKSTDALQKQSEVQVTLERQRTLLDLYDEWQSNSVREARRRVTGVIDIGGLKSLSDYEAMQSAAFSAAPPDGHTADDADATFQMMDFFEKLARAEILDLVTHDSVLLLFGTYFEYWRDAFVHEIYTKEEPNRHFRMKLELIAAMMQND